MSDCGIGDITEQEMFGGPSSTLDSNVLAELRPGKPKPSPQVRQWAATVAQQ
ncbi:MAG: hypothetical protein Q4A98_02580 [Comamonadaceae bacterium]|nr:hypothetical protein [Comamonadaceae bacterium]